ncbi:MAG TPA: response regulator [Verrucomicrobiae bacterium]|nr:response regulator [Verrucomicrobiae bacterium]
MDRNRALPVLGEFQAILIVDDDRHVLKFVAGMFQSLGYSNVFQAASPEEALAIWSNELERINLLVSDFVMPLLTGDQMATRMLEQKPALKILFISGNDPVTLDSVIPLQAGQNFLQKPFTLAQVRRSIQNLALSA